VFVRDPEPPLWTTTDADGRFRIDGIAAGEHELIVTPQDGQPYLTTRFPVDTTKGAAAFECTLELVRQQMIVGRVTDRATGQPVTGSVEYRASSANPNLEAANDLAQPRWNGRNARAEIDTGGKFALPAPPGPGVLLVLANGAYRPARLSAADRKALPAFKDDAAVLDTKPHPFVPTEFHAVRAVEVPKGGGDVTVDLTVDAGRSVALDVRYPDNKPRETWVLGLAPDLPATPYPMKEFTPKRDRVGGLMADEPRRLFAITRDGALGGHRVLTGGEADSVTVEMKPTGAVTGRLVDAAGKPLALQGFQLYYEDGAEGVSVSWGHVYRLPSAAEMRRRERMGMIENRWGRFSQSEQSAADGTFRIAERIAEVPFDLWVVRVEARPDPKGKEPLRTIAGYVKVARVTLKPGETKALGDLVVKSPD
jgi:hypothetical protein